MALRTDLRVLVVDDMSVSRQILAQMLEHLGISRVTIAANANDAIASLEKTPADLVISDLNMPGMNGLELLRSMRCHRRNRNTRFVLTSAQDQSPQFAAARALGMDALLIKPFRIDMLLHCVELATGRL